ncbi:MAG: hypothetical protein FD180_3357 [Planctomycetota bacterium]|nr:MAG: hypothetical protein FD180_3357 [Planctomycetota bacterium]
MPTRDEALRRMLETHSAASAMTPEERQELCDHLCDAVEAKVKGGTAELQAAAEAFAEIGDLRKIAKSFPRGPALATTGGLLVAVSGWTAPAAAYLLLAGLWFLSVFVAPRTIMMASDANLDLPALVCFFLAATAHCGRGVLLFAVAPVAAALVLRRFGWKSVFQTSSAVLAVVAIVLVLGGVVAITVVGASVK